MAPYWRRGSPFPGDVWTAIGAGVLLPALVGVWALSNDSAFAFDLLLIAVVTLGGYFFLTAKWGREIIASRGRWDFAAIGLSTQGGPLLVALGAVGFLAVLLFAQIPSWALGVPQYAFDVDSATAVVLVAPLREEVLLGGVVWSIVYNATARAGGGARFAAATLVSALFFTALHGATYDGAATFAFVQLFTMRIFFAAINWAPTKFGYAPSLVPSVTAHVLQNGLWYFVTCVQGSGLQSVLATRLC